MPVTVTAVGCGSALVSDAYPVANVVDIPAHTGCHVTSTRLPVPFPSATARLDPSMLTTAVLVEVTTRPSVRPSGIKSPSSMMAAMKSVAVWPSMDSRLCTVAVIVFVVLDDPERAMPMLETAIAVNPTALVEADETVTTVEPIVTPCALA